MTACAHCGKEPLLCLNSDGEEVEVDACFEGAISGGWPVSACCGHGDRSKAYVRLDVRDGSGAWRSVDLCGFVVQPLGAFLGHYDLAEQFPPRNVA